MRLALVFGGSGSIGQSICENFTEQGSRVIGVRRTNNPHNEIVEWVTWTGDDKQFCQNLKELLIESKIDCVIWAQGMNCNDDIDSFNQYYLNLDSSCKIESLDKNTVYTFGDSVHNFVNDSNKLRVNFVFELMD